MSRVTPSLEPDIWKRWDAPIIGVEQRTSDEEASARAPTEEELRQLRQAAYEEGFATGRTDGMASGRREMQAQAQIFGDLAAALQQPFNDLDEQLERELVVLVIAMVRQLVRREIRTDPEVVLAAVREALSVLPVSSRGITIQLHPDDAAIAGPIFASNGPTEDWKIAENPALTRGGCMVITDTSQVDATVERRLSSVICRVFGGERSTDLARDVSTDSADAASEPPAHPVNR